jgi:hypothetical protein
MDRRWFLKTTPVAAAGLHWLAPDGNAQSLAEVPAISEDHFPSRLHQFVWRNWELANIDRMAQVVHGKPEQLLALGASMGLPRKRGLSENYLKRIYITVIRQNWHLLPENQIIELLGWNETKYRFTLKEDDFLDVKLGRVKPACEPLSYAEPSQDQQRRAAEIRALLNKWFGKRLNEPGEDRFAFVQELSSRPSGSLRSRQQKPPAGHIDLTSGWTLASEGEASAAENLRWFLTERMGVELAAATSDARKVVLRTERRPETEWTVETSAERVVITAGNAAALQRAVYDIQSEMERLEAPWLPVGKSSKREAWSPRYLYSYFALYGDPLMEGDAAGLPDAYLERAAMSGMEGVWIQGVLNTLAPSRAFPEFGEGWQTRLRNLRALVERAGRYGMRIYLYLNEPRAMPAPFFASRPEIRGSRHLDVYAMCTSTEVVRDWIRSAVSAVFREAPGLGGLFSITMSENHTNCFSHGGAWGNRDPVVKDCPRCSKRTGADAIAELITTFRDGVREHSKTAEVISYDWGWGTPLADALIPLLPADSSVLSISEWSQPVERGGVKTAVGEYSMSVVGPGPRATRNWALAKKHKLRTVAKTQFNNTWEISAVPWIPVMPLVVEHCRNLANASIDGTMPSWTCGGYPSPNLRAAASYAFEPRPDDATVLRQEAERMYGAAMADEAVAAWETFSDAFLEFPYGVAIYIIPTQHGPANLLRPKPTNLKAGMILFPYDAYKSWSGAYPPDIVRSQFRKLAAKWRTGLDMLERVVAKAPATKKRAAERELAIARTCHIHFESTANQVEFYLLRDGLPQMTVEEKGRSRKRMIEIIRQERDLSRAQYFVARNESLIGYEASNHYYYTPLDLVEKMLNCEYLEQQMRKEMA